MSLGITISGFTLELSRHFHGGPLNLRDFMFAYGLITVMALVALPTYAKLRADAGANISGQKLNEAEA